jgi:hypothetical protein
MRALFVVALMATMAVASKTENRQVSRDFSGTWVWDAARSDHHPAAESMVVTQTETELRIHATLCCRQAGEEWITTYHFNRWGSRNATRGSATTPPRGSPDDKPTQARWDGETLVMHAGPEQGVQGGSVRLWRLVAGGTELVEEVLNRGLGLRFNFKEASIPNMYTRDKHVYVKR